MKLIKTLALILSVSLMAACGTPESDQKPEQTPAPTADAVNIAFYYHGLDKDNHFDVTEKETLENILTHGTAIVHLGFPECPWCQAYIPLLEDALAEQDARCSYYNIFMDKGGDREFYDKIADLLISQNDTGEDIVQYDNDGLKVIYMPLVLFVEKGRITAFDNETCMESSDQISPEKYWTSARRAALKTKLAENIERVAALQAENASKGCDTGCKVGD